MLTENFCPGIGLRIDKEGVKEFIFVFSHCILSFAASGPISESGAMKVESKRLARKKWKGSLRSLEQFPLCAAGMLKLINIYCMKVKKRLIVVLPRGQEKGERNVFPHILLFLHPGKSKWDRNEHCLQQQLSWW